jgi:hypothetical protein
MSMRERYALLAALEAWQRKLYSRYPHLVFQHNRIYCRHLDVVIGLLPVW